VKIAVVQKAPVFLDREGSIAKVLEEMRAAAELGARLVVFPEAFIPGYPAWIWRLRPGPDHAIISDLHCQLVAASLRIGDKEIVRLQEAARELEITVVCGIIERDSENSGTTLYNTMLVIDADGSLINRHRKLVPTNAERMVWGQGDGAGLRVSQTACGKLGGLICWENYMPLARYSLYAQGIEIYVAPTYDSGENWINSMRHIAREGACWVVACSNAFTAADIPTSLPSKTQIYPDDYEWVNPGDSLVVAPDGRVVVGPFHQQQGTFLVDIDLNEIVRARRSLDVAGHFARPDVLDLHITQNVFRAIRLKC
jgi:nitrilase